MSDTIHSNATIETLLSRRSIRSYKPEAVSEDLVRRVMELGTFAPTGMGKQSPRIIWVRNEEDKETIRKLNKSYMAVKLAEDADTFYRAPEIIIVIADKTRVLTPFEDGSCVLTYMMVAAASFGLGSCWINREKQIFESEEGKTLLSKWGFDPEKYVGVGALSLGWPDGEPALAHVREEDYIHEV